LKRAPFYFSRFTSCVLHVLDDRVAELGALRFDSV
jgi:hypothetical protein